MPTTKRKLFAVATEQKSAPQLAREAVKRHYTMNEYFAAIGDKYNHRGWPPDVVRAFVTADVIKPQPGELQRRLYGR